MYTTTEKSTVDNLTLFSIVGIVAIVAVVGLLQTTGTTTYAQPAQVAQAPAVSSGSVSGGGNAVGQFGAGIDICTIATEACDSMDANENPRDTAAMCSLADDACGRTGSGSAGGVGVREFR